MPDRHYSKIRFVRGDEAQRETWRIDYEERAIWGITASMTRMFRETALAQELATMSNEQLEMLRQADWLQRASVRKVFEILDGDDGQTKAVGGIVRNTLLGDETGDVDMASKFTPNEILDRARRPVLKPSQRALNMAP